MTPSDLSLPRPSRRTRLGALLAATGLITAGVAPAPAIAATNDPLRDQQWGLDQINAGEAWASASWISRMAPRAPSGSNTRPNISSPYS